MPRAAPIQNAFNSGEFSDRLEGRTDLRRYAYALERCENFLLFPQGGAHRRSGSRFVAEVKDSTRTTRLTPFIFSNVQAYIFEWSHQRLRFYRNEGLIQAATGSWTGDVTHVDTAADTIKIDGGHFYVDQQGPFRLTTGGTLPAGLAVATDYYIKTTADVTKFQLSLTPGGAAIDLTTTGAGTSTIAPFGTVPCEVVVPYTESQVFDLAFAQSADVLYLVHTLHAPSKLVRTDNDKWTLSEIDLLDGPYGSTNTDSTKTLTPSAVTGAITVTAVGFSPFLLGRDEGRLIRLATAPGSWGWVEITSVTSATVVNATVRGANLAAAVATSSWRLGIFYVSNYPGAVTFFEERLGFGGNPTAPQTFYGSKTGDFENFAPTDGAGLVTSDSALSYTLAANDVNNIVWMGYTQALILGTASGIWVVQGTTQLEPITPTNVVVRKNSTTGSRRVLPAYIEDLVAFLSSAQRSVRVLDLSGDQGTQHTSDVTLYARHVTDVPIVQLSYAQDPNSLLWAVRSDGLLFALTIAEIGSDQPVLGWHRHVLGGQFGRISFVAANVDIGNEWVSFTNHGYPDGFGPVRLSTTGTLPAGLQVDTDYWINRVMADTFRFRTSPKTANVVDLASAGSGTQTITPVDVRASVESVATIPSPDESHSQTWLVVRRTLGGVTKRFVEFLEDEFDDRHEIEDAFFVDCGLTGGVVASPQTVWTGLTHLEGETVDALADGSPVQGLVVTGGSITLPVAVIHLHVGLPCPARLKSLRLVVPDPAGSDQGKKRRIDSLVLRLHRTVGGRVGRDEDHLDALVMSQAGDPFGEPIQPFSGDYLVKPFSGNWDAAAKVVVVQDQPLPFTVAAWMPQVRASERP